MDNNITISAFTLFDVLALCSVIACIASAAMRGVMAEVLAFGGWLLSLTVARSLCNIIAEKAFSNLQPHEMAVVISFVLIFVSMRILLHFLHYCLDYFIESGFWWFDWFTKRIVDCEFDGAGLLVYHTA